MSINVGDTGPFVGHPHDMLARIHHEDLLARAEHRRRLQELRLQERSREPRREHATLDRLLGPVRRLLTPASSGSRAVTPAPR